MTSQVQLCVILFCYIVILYYLCYIKIEIKENQTRMNARFYMQLQVSLFRVYLLQNLAVNLFFQSKLQRRIY